MTERPDKLNNQAILLAKQKLINKMEYESCLLRFKKHPERRLPVDEIDKRLARIKRKEEDANDKKIKNTL